MRKGLLRFCLCVGCLVSAAASLSAQEVIHALTGTVTSINASAKSITLLQDNGSKVDYHLRSDSKTRIVFDKNVADGTTAAETFNEKDAYVIVFYYGEQTAVALKNLGAGPFTSAQGTVAKFDSHAHSLSIQDEKGATQNFRLTSDSVVESNFGAVDGLKFQAQKGDHVRIVAATVNGAPTALFLRDN
jgi:Cu/Ag efflux protein CusF